MGEGLFDDYVESARRRAPPKNRPPSSADIADHADQGRGDASAKIDAARLVMRTQLYSRP